MGDDVVDQAPGERGRRVEEVAGGAELARAAGRRSPRTSSTVSPQPGMIPTRVWVSAKRARSDATRKSQFDASSKPPVIAGAVDRADEQLRARRERAAEPANWPISSRRYGSSVSVVPLAQADGPSVEVARQLLEVGAGTERRIRAREDHDVDRRRRPRARRSVARAAAERAVDRVAGLGPVQRDRRRPAPSTSTRTTRRPSAVAHADVPVEDAPRVVGEHGLLLVR